MAETSTNNTNDKQIIYSMSKVGKVHGTKQVLRDISLSYFYGAKIGVLGANGSGKSTLLKIMAGRDDNHLGQAVLSKGYTVGYLEQEPNLAPEKSVKECVSEGVAPILNLLKEFEDVNEKFALPMSDEEMDKLLEKQAKLQDKLDAVGAWDIDSKIDYAMAALNCPPEEQLIKTLSGGEKRRVALCRLLLQVPDILLLDEPTNHLDAESVWWLERHLQQYKGTVIAVTHDRYFLDNVAGWILELDRGHGIPFKGNYSGWLEQKAKRLAIEEKQESKRQKALKEELEWIQSSPKARQAKSKARIKNYEERMREGHERRTDTNEIFIPSGPRLGKIVLEATNISKSFDHKLLYENLSFALPPGGIIGIIGANGVGKSTLFKMIVGAITPETGSFRLGENVKISYVNQDRDFDPSQTILDVLAHGQEFIEIEGKSVNARAYLSKFNFSGDDQKKRMGELSGGERNRVHLACTLQQGGNLLLLDEPTNDLDVHTLQALERALLDFPGCAVVISHDRYFLDRIATHILAFEGDSKVEWFDGNFSDYEEDKLKRLGEAALKPKRLTYKNLIRN